MCVRTCVCVCVCVREKYEKNTSRTVEAEVCPMHSHVYSLELNNKVTF